jgi:hypothetical protein
MRHAMSFPGQFIVGMAAVALLCVCLVLNAEEPGVAASAPPAARKWFVEAGPFWRAGGDVEVRINSLPAIPYSRPTVTARSSVGPADRVADREYDDGYVRMDYGTGVWDNNTWYWGYSNSGQVVGEQLVFHGSTYTAFGQSVSPRDRFSFDLDDEIGGEARIGRNLFDCKCGTGSLVLGLGYTSFGGSTGFQDLGYVWSEQGGTITDTYNLLTDPGELPAAPYSGTKEGPGYIIPNIPTQRQISGGAGRGGSPLTEIYHCVRQTMDVDLWVLSLGLDVRGKRRAPGERRCISYVVGAGLTGNFVNADSDFQWSAVENGVTLDSARFSEDDSDLVVGLYGEAGILFALSERLSLTLRARYDHVFDDAEVGFSNTKADIDLSGVSGVAGFGVLF